jgi:hypothetical protein
LAVVVGIAAAVAAAMGVFTTGGPGAYDVASIHGDVVRLYGEGLYGFDTLLVGVGNRGTDVATLLVELPALVIALLLFRQGTLGGRLLLAGVLSYFLYYYASMTFATAQNPLFPMYVIAFSASLFAFVLTLRSIDARAVAARFPARPSRRVVAGYLIAVAALLTAVWLPSMITSAVTGETASLATYTSSVTHALDLGIIVPVAVAAGVLTWRDRPVGYLLASIMLMLNVTIGLALMAQGGTQLLAGVPLTPGEIVGKILSFAALTLVAVGLSVALVRGSSHDVTVRGERS